MPKITEAETVARDLGHAENGITFVMETRRLDRKQGTTLNVGVAGTETSHRSLSLLDVPGRKKMIKSAGTGLAQVGCMSI